MNNKVKISFSLLFYVFTFLGYGQSSTDEVCEEGVSATLIIEKAEQLLEAEETQSLSYNEAYNKFQELYVKMAGSESEKIKKSFHNKINVRNRVTFESYKNQNDIYKWLSENIESTSFKSLDEAVSEYNEYQKAVCQHYIENEEYWVFFFMVLDKFGAQIVTEVTVDYEMNNFTPPDRELKLDINYWKAIEKP